MVSLWLKEPTDSFQDVWSSERALNDQKTQTGATHEVVARGTGAKL
jgi:hypothetical protein